MLVFEMSAFDLWLATSSRPGEMMDISRLLESSYQSILSVALYDSTLSRAFIRSSLYMVCPERCLTFAVAACLFVPLDAEAGGQQSHASPRAQKRKQ
jgi:hypothetical protein